MANHYLVDRRTTASVPTGTAHVNPRWENKAVTASSFTNVGKTAINEATKSTTTYTNANERVMQLSIWGDSATDTNEYTFGNTVKIGFVRWDGAATAAQAKTAEYTETVTLTKNGNVYEYYYYLNSDTVGSDSFIFILDDDLQIANAASAGTTATIVRNVDSNMNVTTIDRNSTAVTDEIDVSVSPLWVEFKPKTNYKIKTATVQYTYENETKIATFDKEHNSGNIPFDANTEIIITGVSEYVEPSVNPINISASNSVYTIKDKNENDITTWTNESFPITFTAKANEGYYFEVAPRIAYFDNFNNPETAYLTVDETGVYSYTLTNATGAFISFYANAAAETIIKNKYGLITVYNPTLDELKEIAKARYFYESDTYSTRYYKDLGDYIAALHVVYCSFEDLRTQRLYLANYPVSTDLVGVIDNNVVTLNCGNVTIEGKYNNVVDYNAVIKIYLPFIGFRELETAKYMDKTINLTYKLDVISGNAKAFLTVDGVILETFDCVMSYNIPFVKLFDIDGSFQLNANFLWGFNAYVLIDFPRMTGDNTTYGNFVNTCGLIGNYAGFTAFEEITLMTTATETERNEIINILESGVIV